MKTILVIVALVFSFNSIATWKADVTGPKGNFQGNRETEAELKEWYDKQLSRGVFGDPSKVSVIYKDNSIEEIARRDKETEKKAAYDRLKAFNKNSILTSLQLNAVVEDILKVMEVK